MRARPTPPPPHHSSRTSPHVPRLHRDAFGREQCTCNRRFRRSPRQWFNQVSAAVASSEWRRDVLSCSIVCGSSQRKCRGNMRPTFSFFLLSFHCCITLLAAALHCDFQESRGVLSCLLGHRGGAKLAVVISSDVDHAREALDFIGSWSHSPPCSNPPRVANEMDFDRQLLPALILRLSCDWGFKVCDHASRALIDAVRDSTLPSLYLCNIWSGTAAHALLQRAHGEDEYGHVSNC